MIPFDLAISELNKSPNPTEDILRTSAYCHPLQLLYVDLVKNKEMIALIDLPDEEKRRYWNQVKDLEIEEWQKKMKCQSLYVFEWLKK